MENNKRITKKEFWQGSIVSFFKLFFGTILYFTILIGGMLWFDNVFGEFYGGIFIWFFLIISSLGYLYNTNKNYFTKENLRNSILKAKSFSKSFLIFLLYLLLFAVGIIFLFLIGGWIAGLSATSIIIILLVLILLK